MFDYEFDAHEDHFHRVMAGFPRKRVQLVLGSLFVLVWFAMDTAGFVWDHWLAAPACNVTINRTTYEETPIPFEPTTWFPEPAEAREI